MFGLDNKSGINVMPPIAPADSQTPLWFTEGGAGLSATYPGQDWFNQIQAELLNVLKAADIAPQKGSLNQLSSAISKLASAYAVSIVHSTGESITSVMSQKAVTDHLSGKASSSYFMVTEKESRMLSPNQELAVLAHDNKTSGAWDDKLQRMLWAFDDKGTMIHGTVPAARTSGFGKAALKEVGNLAGQLPDMSFFPESGKWTDNGLTTLPNGVMIQAFKRIIANDPRTGYSMTSYVPFPTAFPNGVWAVLCTKTTYVQVIASCEGVTKQGFNVVTVKVVEAPTTESNANFLVLGY